VQPSNQPLPFLFFPTVAQLQPNTGQWPYPAPNPATLTRPTSSGHNIVHHRATPASTSFTLAPSQHRASCCTKETDSGHFPFSIMVTAKRRKVYPQVKPKRSGESQILRYVRILSHFQLEITWRRMSCPSTNLQTIKGSTHRPNCEFLTRKP
jgi:hypothetical protein